MNHPWGISEAAFIAAYIVLLIVPAVVIVVWSAAQRRTVPAGAEYAPPPTLYQLAWVAGGRKRAVETALAVLVERGVLRVDSSRTLQPVHGAPSPTDPFEARVFAAAGGLTSGHVVRWMRFNRAGTGVRDAAELAGLIVPTSSVLARRFVVAALYVAVLAFGLAYLVVGSGYDLSGDALTIVVVVAGIASYSAIRALLGGEPKPTVQGIRALEHARSTSSGAWVGAGAAVLFGGLAAYPDSAIASALTYQRGSSGSGGSSSCGDSCGGGCGD